MVLQVALASLLSLSAHAGGSSVSQAQTSGVVPLQLSFSNVSKVLSWDKVLPGIPGLNVTSGLMNLVGPKLEPAAKQEPNVKPPQAAGLPAAKVLNAAAAAPARPFGGKFTPAPLAQGKNAALAAAQDSKSITGSAGAANGALLSSLKETPDSNGEAASTAGGKFWENASEAGGTVKRVEDHPQSSGRGRNVAEGGENQKGNSTRSHGGPSSLPTQAPASPTAAQTHSPGAGGAHLSDDSAGGRQADELPPFGRTPQYALPGGDLDQETPTQAPPVALLALKLVGQGFILTDNGSFGTAGTDTRQVGTTNGSSSQWGYNGPATVAASAVADAPYSAFQSPDLTDLRDAVAAAPLNEAYLANAGAAEMFSYASPATLLARSGLSARTASLKAKSSVPGSGKTKPSRPAEPAWFLLLPLALVAVRYKAEYF
jgi:hypothetical protein